ncbi:MotA/TolQ/ExbB proton channel family protein [Methylococcus geothermalis]|uniref:MotA/TolQ/ExbB proton channel family protein n=1 Tax=Methylococcus geothermalis TaxID=2681310 RepID=A0A858QBD8_9GAMM|nr:MotA/TolQ/ExbB proton channel family protein [Methylococcus geothermalis]QJD31120.1 MotA/TolQ/ExbB proton channel family protein [Methylococcus geothermalis]
MLDIIKGGGLLIWPILICSVVALAIILERLWALRTSRILPAELASTVWTLWRNNQLDGGSIRQLALNSPLGTVLAAGLANHKHGREVMQSCIEQAGRQVVHAMERYLNTLGTIASISPYLGLLGSVLGMMKVFAGFSAAQGAGNPAALAGGLSEILITTAAGLAVAIPSLMFYRYFRGRVNELSMRLEEEAVRLIAILHGEREE